MVRAQTGKSWIGFFLLLLGATLLMLRATVAEDAVAAASAEPITPVPLTGPADAAKIALGERLFRDVRLSGSNALACTSCHQLDGGGDDGLARSLALDGRSLDFNAPTVFNVALNFRLNWRGNFRTLKAQNEAALLDDALMDANWGELAAKLRADPDYARRFAELYDEPPDRSGVLDALAAFQRSLITPNARFDRYLRGERAAITAEEEQGYQLFKAYGCVACHQGVNVGGNLFQKFGVFSDPFAGPRPKSRADLGRLAITGAEADRHVFRVPSLRNVAVTAPYFHDGSAASLEEAVEVMARSQLGRELAPGDVAPIVAFLGTLTGEYRGRPLSGDTASSRP